MGYMYRYNPGIILLHQFLERGWLGEVFEVHTVMSKVVNPKFRKELAEYPGGMMFELGCHLLDLVVGVLGKPDRVTPHHRQSAHPDDTLRDNMLAVLEYPRALATVKSTGLEVDGFARRHLTVCGTKGTFHLQPLDDPRARVTFDRERRDPGEKGRVYKAEFQDVSFPRFRRYVADAADFAATIRGEKAFGFSYEHDLAVQEAVLKASGLPTT